MAGDDPLVVSKRVCNQRSDPSYGQGQDKWSQRGLNCESLEKRSARHLARCSRPAELQGVRIRLASGDPAGRLVFDTFRLRTFDLTPEGRLSHRPAHVEHFGNLLPVKSSATRAKHGSTLIRKIAAGVVQTRIGELRTTKCHRIAPQLCGEQLADTRMVRADEGDSRSHRRMRFFGRSVRSRMTGMTTARGLAVLSPSSCSTQVWYLRLGVKPGCDRLSCGESVTFFARKPLLQRPDSACP